MRRKKKYPSLSTKPKKKLITPARLKEVFSWVFTTVITVAIALMLTFAFGARVRMVGDSMEPTIHSSQQVLIDRLTYRMLSPKRGDVIAFLPNGNTKSHEYLKRVVAVGGDTVLIEDGVLYVNGQPQDETHEVYDKIEEAGIAQSTLTLQPGEFFVLGDKRSGSEDSRSANIGPVRRETIVGKAWYVIGGGHDNGGLVSSPED